jgi:predicted Zn-dependent protease with MMP-like domain
MRVSRRKFEVLVERALGTIPAEIRGRMDNVEIVVEDWPDEGHYATVGLEATETLFGLYEGVPLIERGVVADPLLPDKITIFQGPLEEACDTDDEIAEEIRKTVVHEIAHHFGIDDARLADLGYG